MGTSWLSGWNYDDHPDDETIIRALRDPSLMDALLEYFPDPNDPTEDHCFEGKGRRVEELNLTDVLLFDYQVKHRGGRNASPDLRSLLYLTYARKWYKDTNFASRYAAKKVKDLAFAVGAGTDHLSTARKTKYARVVSQARFADVAPRGDSLQNERSGRTRSRERAHLSQTLRETIAHRRKSEIEWKPIEIRGCKKVGHVEIALSSPRRASPRSRRARTRARPRAATRRPTSPPSRAPSPSTPRADTPTTTTRPGSGPSGRRRRRPRWRRRPRRSPSPAPTASTRPNYDSPLC